MKAIPITLCIILVAVDALSADECLNKFQKVVAECRSNHDITDRDMKLAKEGKADLDQSKAKCAATCILKGLGLINEADKMNEEKFDSAIECFIKSKAATRGSLPCQSECAHVLKDTARTCALELKQKNLTGCDVGAFFTKCTKDALNYLPM